MEKNFFNILEIERKKERVREGEGDREWDGKGEVGRDRGRREGGREREANCN